MNIFVLDRNMEKSVQAHVDAHVRKMPIETAQMLSTILRERYQVVLPSEGTNKIYKTAYINHPCTRWVGETQENFMWALQFGAMLCKEYTYRFGKVHATESVLTTILAHAPDASMWNYNVLTEPPKCVRADFKRYDVVTAYRYQYIYVKQRLHKWTHRPVPAWITDQSWMERGTK